MTPWQEGFVKQCEARGINPSAVAKYAEDYSEGQKAAQRMLAKRAAAAKAAFDSMTPYQQGFAARCHQRGILSEKVASWVMRKKAQEGPDGIGPTLGNEAAYLADKATQESAARAVADAVANNTAGADADFDSLLAAAITSADDEASAQNEADLAAYDKARKDMRNAEIAAERASAEEDLASVRRNFLEGIGKTRTRPHEGWNEMTPHERQARGLPLEKPKSKLDEIADRLSSAGKAVGDAVTDNKAVRAARAFIDQHDPDAIRARAALVGIDPDFAPTDANIAKRRVDRAVAKGQDYYGKVVDKGNEVYDKVKEYFGKAVAKGKEYSGKAKAEGKKVYDRGKKYYGKAKQYAKDHPGRAAAVGGGAALTAALLGAYLLSRKKKKKAKK